MRKSAIIIMPTILITALLLLSCQPTPAEEQVAGKDTLNIEQAGPNEAEEINTVLLDIPDTYEKELVYAEGALKVQIQAKVVKPDTSSIPVAKLDTREVDNATKDKWFDFLSEGKPLYYVRGEEEYSKPELEELLLAVKAGTHSDLHARDPEAYYEMFGDDIKRLETLYAAAPETPNLREYDKDSAEPIDLEVDLGRKKPASIQLVTKSPYGFSFGFANVDTHKPDGGVTEVDVTDGTPIPSIPLEDAQNIAKQYVEGLGLSDFEINKVGLIPDWDIIALQTEIDYSAPPPCCYIFYFTKTIGGMTETYVNPSFRNLADEQVYGSVWMPECVAVTVSDAGVQSIQYESNPSEAEIIEENAKIISFDEAIDRFSKQIELSGVWGLYQGDENIVERRVNIDRIELGGMRIISKDNANGYLYIPVWSFFGSITNKWADGTGDTNQLNKSNEATVFELAQCILTINAIDGSVINRSLGY